MRISYKFLIYKSVSTVVNNPKINYCSIAKICLVMFHSQLSKYTYIYLENNQNGEQKTESLFCDSKQSLWSTTARIKELWYNTSALNN